MVSCSEKRKDAFRELGENVQKLSLAIAEGNFDSQLIFIEQALENLKDAKEATLKIHGGINN